MALRINNMMIMRRVLTMTIILCCSYSGFSQEIVIKDFHYRLVSTELSPKQAIQQARKEALTACVQENLGTEVMNLTRLEKQEKDKKYSEKFNDFTQQISNGYVRRYVMKDTSSVYDNKTLSLETSVTMDITLYKPENDNSVGLYASSDKSTYKNEESAQITYSVKSPAFFYLLDLTFNNEFCLLHESKEPVADNKDVVFPKKNMSFELSMAKEDKSDFEFGSFVIIASVRPINFGVPAADINHSNCSYLKFDKFFSVISGVKKDCSIKYLPYCIE